jgi:hypothetical protein
MRFGSKRALLVLVLSAATARVTHANEKANSSGGSYRAPGENPDPQQPQSKIRPLTRREGLAILRVALSSRHHADDGLDCSHFVHDLYERAGFSYEYANSSDLYAGIEEFKRVSVAQAGDLAVWRGHVGIVVDPAQRSFYSVLHSGPRVDYYDSPYWRRRGRPRFFRYVEAIPRNDISNTIRSANWNSRVTGNDRVSGNAAPREIDVQERLPDMPEQSSSRSGSSAPRAENRAANAANYEMPVVIVNSARPKPDQVSAAFLKACADLEASSHGRELFDSTHSISATASAESFSASSRAPSFSALALIVFDEFKVEKLHISGKQGWVDVQIDEVVSVTNGKLDERRGPNYRPVRQRWFLTRYENKSWKLSPARNAIYVPQYSAERMVAHELAQLTEDNGADNNDILREKVELARLLNLLFEK